MAIVTAMCTSYKKELFQAVHNHGAAGNVFNIALYTSAATLGATTAGYTATGEVATAGGYTARGVALTNIEPQESGTTGFTHFDGPIVWAASTITARGALIFNVTSSDVSVSVHDFGQDYISTDGDFSVFMPVNDANTALLRLV